jgi:hypothetical protein
MRFSMGLEETCPVRTSCANFEIKCHLCHNQSHFKTGASRGKGTHAEKRLRAQRNGPQAHLRKGSGALAHAKGDLIDDQLLIEMKSGYAQKTSTGKKSFTLQRVWLEKIEREALAEGRLGVLTVHFDGSPDDEIWAVVRAQTLFDLLDPST